MPVMRLAGSATAMPAASAASPEIGKLIRNGTPLLIR
jgi:hypothetical protein